MSGDLVVGAVILLIVVGAVAYMLWQKKKGISSCGCKDCNCGCAMAGSNVKVDEAECPLCKTEDKN